MQEKHDLDLKFNVKISEMLDDNQEENTDFIINGEAIHAVITDNGHEFLAEELKKSAKSLINKPLLKDHTNSVDSIAGKVLEASYNEEKQSIDFRALVLDEGCKMKISQGLLNTVSVGAVIEKVVYDEKEDKFTLYGITFKELSLVAVPADDKAIFNMENAMITIAESFNNHINVNSPINNKEEEIKMDENMKEMLEAKSAELEESNKKLEESLKALEASKNELKKIEEAKLNDLKESYKKLAEEKKVKAVDVSAMSESVVKTLIEQLESIEDEEVEEEDVTKGKVDNGEDEMDESLEKCFITKDDVVEGYAFFQAPTSKDKKSVFYRG